MVLEILLSRVGTPSIRDAPSEPGHSHPDAIVEGLMSEPLASLSIGAAATAGVR
jgi:hypothetical protein